MEYNVLFLMERSPRIVCEDCFNTDKGNKYLAKPCQDEI